MAPTATKGGVNPIQVGLGMTFGSIAPNFLQGSIQTTNRNTDMAIQGDGFFVLANGSDRTYTRAGAFTLDANGNLVDSGDRLQGAGRQRQHQGQHWASRARPRRPRQAATFKGNLDFAAVEDSTFVATFNVLDSVGSAHTLTVTFTKNFSAVAGEWDWAVTPSATDSAVANLTAAVGSVFFDAGGVAVASATQNITFQPDVTTGTDTNNASKYLGIDTGADLSITGPGGASAIAVTVAGDDTVSSTGNATSAIAVANKINAATATTKVSARATATRISYTAGTFASDITLDGTASSSTAPASSPRAPARPSASSTPPAPASPPRRPSRWTSAPPPNTTPVTGVAAPSTVTLASQDGVQSGTLQSFAIGLDGAITTFFSNGKSSTLDTVQLASFANAAGLIKIGSNQYRESATSGTAATGHPGTGGRGTLVAGALEQSNVDLAQEFSSMIIAERGFQANARTISTANSMLEELVNLKR